MKKLSATAVARNFSAVLDALERDREEIVLVRNERQVARLVPEANKSRPTWRAATGPVPAARGAS